MTESMTAAETLDAATTLGRSIRELIQEKLDEMMTIVVANETDEMTVLRTSSGAWGLAYALGCINAPYEDRTGATQVEWAAAVDRARTLVALGADRDE